MRSHRHRWRAATVFLAALSFSALHADADSPPVSDAPLRLTSQAPFQSIRLGLTPLPPSLEEGEIRVETTAAWSKIWINRLPEMLLDYESLDSHLVMTYGLSGTSAIQFEAVNDNRFGGELDSLVRTIHRFIGSGLNGRDQFPRDSAYVLIRDDKTGRVLIEGSGQVSQPFSRALLSTFSKSIETRSGVISLGTTVRVPILAFSNARRSLDVGGTASLTKHLGSTAIQVAAEISRSGAEHLDTIPLRHFQWSTLIAASHPVSGRGTFILQYLTTEGIAEAGPLATRSYELAIGGRYRLAGATAVEFGLIENMLHYETGPDFAIHFGLSTKLPSRRASRVSRVGSESGKPTMSGQ
jgi:hypothetical protein